MSHPEFVFSAYIKIMNCPGKMRKLIRYADKLLYRNKIRGRAISARDVISEVVTKIAYEERNWRIEKEPDLYFPLFLLIRSYVDSITKKEKHSAKPLLHCHNNQDYDELYAEYVHKHTTIKNEQTDDNEDYIRLFSKCLKALKKDDECGLILLGIGEGQSWKDIACDLNISVQKVNAIMARARKKLRHTPVMAHKNKTYR